MKHRHLYSSLDPNVVHGDTAGTQSVRVHFFRYMLPCPPLCPCPCFQNCHVCVHATWGIIHADLEKLSALAVWLVNNPILRRKGVCLSFILSWETYGIYFNIKLLRERTKNTFIANESREVSYKQLMYFKFKAWYPQAVHWNLRILSVAICRANR